MPILPKEVFEEACAMAVKENAAYVPPFGSNGSLYLRPFMFGHGPKLGLGKAPTYTFGVVANPVGNYYPQGPKPVKAVVLKEYDRAAPFGAGNAKCAGNYAPDIIPSEQASKRGFTVVLYLDAAKHKYVEEFSTSNFIAISKNKKKYITPDSRSILASVTNATLQEIARDMGLTVETRKIPFSEVKRFSEVAACGTAVVITPISSITNDNTREGEDAVTTIGDGTFPVMESLYQRVRGIQNGEQPDKFGWLKNVGKRV
jgi:branched-chain amino acid aminotransferase